MARGRPLRLGEGARCSVLLKYLQPSRDVASTFPNVTSTQRLDDLVAVRRAQHTRRGRSIDTVFFTSPTFPGIEMSAARKRVVVLAEGHADSLWPDVAQEVERAIAAAEVVVENEGIDPEVFDARNNAEDIARVRAEGFEVDDDNDPAPENVPALWDVAPVGNGDLFEGQSWGWDGVDRRVTAGGNYDEPSFANSWTPIGKTYLEIFLHFLPMTWIATVLVPLTSTSIINSAAQEMSLGEFYRFLGIRLMMATCSGWSVDDFWSMNETHQRDQETDPCPYNFRTYMSKRRFLAITRFLSFTQAQPPRFADKFWEVREMIRAFNEHMASIFVAAWVICLDESMSIWHNRWTCPGWIFCPRKPHPFGNEYHSASCGLSKIMFSIELVEGKDAPAGMQRPFEALGKTSGLLLRMLQSYFGTCKYIVLDSGFCVMKAIVELRRNGLFGCALIKKRKYWPKHVPGDAMKAFFQQDGVQVGDFNAVTGRLDGIDYNIWAMKEPDYVMKMMTSGGPLLSNDSCKEASRTWVEDGIEMSRRFRYACPFDWHFKYRHAVDDHNNLRHALPSVEDSWRTMRWEVRVFSFILAVCEVNAYLALKYFSYSKGTIEGLPTLVVFRRRLAWLLINNAWIIQEEQRAREVGEQTIHVLMTAPPHAKKFRYQRWDCSAAAAYQQYACGERCGKKIRTYCACNPGAWLCYNCFPKHVRTSESEGELNGG